MGRGDHGGRDLDRQWHGRRRPSHLVTAPWVGKLHTSGNRWALPGEVVEPARGKLHPAQTTVLTVRRRAVDLLALGADAGSRPADVLKLGSA